MEYDPRIYDLSMEPDDEAFCDVDNDLDFKLDPDAEGEYNANGGTDTMPTINIDGSIPQSMRTFVGKSMKIKMTGSRSSDQKKYKFDKTFQYAEIHHGPITGSPGNAHCYLSEVQAYYHHLAAHKGAVGQWNDLVRKNKQGTIYKK